MKVRIFYFLLSILFISGCAVAPQRGIFEKAGGQIGGINYVGLLPACEAHNIKFDWDPITDKLVLRKNNVEVGLLINSPVVTVNGQAAKLDGPVLLSNGAVYVPETFARRAIVHIFEPAPPLPGYTAPPAKRRDEIRHRIERIVIDPGHGGNDPGAIGRYGLREKDVVLDIAKRLADKLRQDIAQVVLTRSADSFIPLTRRAEIANAAKADFFISIHANSARRGWAYGVETYYLSNKADDVARARTAYENEPSLAEEANVALLDIIYTENRQEAYELANYICKSISNALGIRNRGIKPAQFSVLRGARMPAILVEVGFISNRAEEVKLRGITYRDKIAEAIYRGVIAYKAEYERTNGFSD